MSRANKSKQTRDRRRQPPIARSFSELTRRQRVLLVLVLAALPILALAGLEAALRLGGYGSSFPLFVPHEAAPEYLTPNPEIARRYFRFGDAPPAPPRDLLRSDKAPGSYRIFVQGGSTAAGFPYSFGGAFARMLEQRLQETFPDREIEVVNTALDAVTTYTLLDLAPEIIKQSPDAVLLYAGHNEYYGVLGVASGESVGRVRWVVRSYIALRKLRTAQLLGDVFGSLSSLFSSMFRGEPPPPGTLMEYLASQHTVRYGSPLHRAGLTQFRRNLDDLLRLYADAGVPVFIGTLASNERDQAPFIGEPDASVNAAEWARLLEEGERAVAADDRAAAGDAIEALIRMDSTVGRPFFLRGRLLDHPGEYDHAQANYVAAKDRDQLPFRAPAAINQIIREVAGQHGAVVVETRQALANASTGGVIGESLMLEHLHPNIDGQFLLSDAYYQALQRHGEVGPWTTPVPREEARPRVPVTAVDSLFAAYNVARLTARFPFQPAESSALVPADTMRGDNRVEEIALAYYRRQIIWPEAMAELRRHYEESEEWERAIHVDLILAQELAFSPVPLLSAGQTALHRRGGAPPDRGGRTAAHGGCFAHTGRPSRGEGRPRYGPAILPAGRSARAGRSTDECGLEGLRRDSGSGEHGATATRMRLPTWARPISWLGSTEVPVRPRSGHSSYPLATRPQDNSRDGSPKRRLARIDQRTSRHRPNSAGNGVQRPQTPPKRFRQAPIRASRRLAAQ